MKEYTWEIKAADKAQNSLLVEYTFNGTTLTLNLPYPTTDVKEHVAAFAPLEIINAEQTDIVVEVGQSGTVRVDQADSFVQEEEPNVTGSWNEEHLRALIYQVLEEINESSV